MSTPRRAPQRRRRPPGLPGLRRLIPPGTRLLMGLITLVTFAPHVLPARALPWIVIQPETLPLFRLSALALSGFVADPMHFISLVLLLGLAALSLGPNLRWIWAQHSRNLILGFGAVMVMVLLGEAIMAPNFGVGWVVSLGLVGFMAPNAERVWGKEKLLVFVALVVLIADLVGATLLWLWPGGLSGLVSGLGRAPTGIDPLFHALITVFGLINYRRPLAPLPFTGRAIIWAVVALDTFDVLFISAIDGLMALAAVGAAVLLVTGEWRPGRLIVRLRLALRSRTRRAPDLRIVPDPDDDAPRTLH